TCQILCTSEGRGDVQAAGSKKATGTPCPGQPTISALWNCAAQSPRYSTRSYFWRRRTTAIISQLSATCPLMISPTDPNHPSARPHTHATEQQDTLETIQAGAGK